jgi:hypothetical protein
MGRGDEKEFRTTFAVIFWIVVALLVWFIWFTPDREPAKYRHVNNTTTMRACLAEIQVSSGSLGFEFMTDKPDIVSGYLSSGEHSGEDFACERKITGTRGTYFSGWYSYQVD